MKIKMQIYTSLEEIPNNFGPSVVTLGNFDGVHLGHRELFRRVLDFARRSDCLSTVFTFNPHPLKLLAPDRAPQLINTTDEKRRLIEASNMDVLVDAPFTLELASMPPDQFVDQILLAKLRVKKLVVGYDYAFGQGRCGSVEFLVDSGRKKGFEVEVLQPVNSDGLPYSSTRIRNAISAGEVASVVNLLGRHYNLEGVVVPGDQRGRELGFPTANLQSDKELLPSAGVYAVKAKYGERIYDAVANLGTRPTFGPGRATIEVYLLDFKGTLYGESLRIYFFERLRSEQRFPGFDALKHAIAADIQNARKILGGQSILEYKQYLSW
jgi:riboflavin kinase/FMN adenylyltransferase